MPSNERVAKILRATYEEVEKIRKEISAGSK